MQIKMTGKSRDLSKPVLASNTTNPGASDARAKASLERGVFRIVTRGTNRRRRRCDANPIGLEMAYLGKGFEPPSSCAPAIGPASGRPCPGSPCLPELPGAAACSLRSELLGGTVFMVSAQPARASEASAIAMLTRIDVPNPRELPHASPVAYRLTHQIFNRQSAVCFRDLQREPCDATAFDEISMRIVVKLASGDSDEFSHYSKCKSQCDLALCGAEPAPGLG
jgi:hypothetical protein